MKQMSTETLELGNLLFGHSRGNFYIEDRRGWEKIFSKLLDELNMECHAEPFENETFIIRPYYWGEDEKIMALPNFEFKPNNFTMSWYKYALRDAYCSHDITKEEFKTIIEGCINSLKGAQKK